MAKRKASKRQPPPPSIRDRIVELRRVKAAELRANPKNWRTHPEAQRRAMQGLLKEIGYAGALIARDVEGVLELIDGHLRADLTPDQEVPVLIVDLDDDEAAKLLALFDPIAGMAETDREALAKLLGDVDTEDAAVRDALESLAEEAGMDLDGEATAGPETETVEFEAAADAPPKVFQVVVECADEDDQREFFARMRAEGRACRLLSR